MANQHIQSGIFRFDQAGDARKNCDSFLSHLESLDAGMAEILRDNWDRLVAIVRDGQRDSGARVNFNAEVAMALDALVNLADPKDGA